MGAPGPRYQNFIAGEWRDPRAGELLEDRNPANPGDLIGLFPRSDAADVADAVAAAQTAQPAWSALSPLKRAEALTRAAALLESRLDALAAEFTREEGKTRREARGETARGVAILRYFAGQASEAVGEVYAAGNPATLLYTVTAPLGPVGLITPWNFPVAIPLWKLAPALLYGNTVVLKPAEATPLMAVRLAEIFAEAGLPRGVLNVVLGDGPGAGAAVVASAGLAGLSFTGSLAVGRRIQAAATQRGARVQVEMGGKNAVVVMADADLDQAAAQTVAGAMLSTGQKCTATSRVIVDRRVLDELTARVCERARALVVGDGLADDTQVGPLISAAARERVLEHVRLAQADGAEVLVGGAAPRGPAYRGGYFVEPTVLGRVRPAMRVAQEEIFGPVLGIIPADGYDEAVAIANGVRFGLSAAIFTRHTGTALRFVRDAQVGLVHVNGETAGAEAHVPFGGMKDSSSFSREQGKAAAGFFTQIKTVYFEPPAT
ncbi:MAG TPA: aldehyde dehydrogenase family protein [Polyangia bacterium]|jgi:aldehyde dehydrogenase (NAD+)